MRDIGRILEVATALGPLRAPWWIAGGWAIDLHLGRVTREHHDIDILVLRRDHELLRAALDGFDLKKIVPHPEGIPGQGTITEWDAGERLELPVHQVNAYRAGKSELAFQVMLGEADGAQWWYRRDRRVQRQLAALGFQPLWGLPYLAPEIILLFKAKMIRPYDQQDFDAVRPMLSGEAKEWLRAALALAHPEHRWIRML